MGRQPARKVDEGRGEDPDRAAKAPTLTTAAMKPVTGEGDPW